MDRWTRLGIIILFLAPGCSPEYTAPEPKDVRTSVPFDDYERAWGRLERRASTLGTITKYRTDEGLLTTEIRDGVQKYVTCGSIEGGGVPRGGAWIASTKRSGSKVNVRATATIRLSETATVDTDYAVNVARIALHDKPEWTESWTWSTGGHAVERDEVREIDVTCTETGKLETKLLAPVR